MRSHYSFDSFFCALGIDGAHVKGGVEGEIGRLRRRHLTSIPRDSPSTLRVRLPSAQHYVPTGCRGACDVAVRGRRACFLPEPLTVRGVRKSLGRLARVRRPSGNALYRVSALLSSLPLSVRSQADRQ
jgi:hypothetical protein